MVSLYTKIVICEMIDILISLIVVVISQHIHILNHGIACFKYIQSLFVDFTSINLGEKRKTIT